MRTTLDDDARLATFWTFSSSVTLTQDVLTTRYIRSATGDANGACCGVIPVKGLAFAVQNHARHVQAPCAKHWKLADLEEFFTRRV
jgi:hypothetical protein